MFYALVNDTTNLNSDNFNNGLKWRAAKRRNKTDNAEADIDFFNELFSTEGSDKEFESLAKPSDEEEGLGISDNDN